MGHQSPSNIYQQVEINSSNQMQLVVMLYEGAIRFISLARTALLNRDLIGKAKNLDRALAIIAELQNTLKMEEGGEIAFQLDRLYHYMNERILESSAKMDPEPLTEVVKLLKILHSAWSEVARKKAEAPAEVNKPSSPLPQVSATPQGNRLSMEIYG